MPFVGLMVFAFMMGARKFVLFDVVHMEVFGCVLGAVVVLPICLMRTRVPLMPLIYRVLVPLFALLLIFLNCFPRIGHERNSMTAAQIPQDLALARGEAAGA